MLCSAEAVPWRGPPADGRFFIAQSAQLQPQTYAGSMGATPLQIPPVASWDWSPAAAAGGAPPILSTSPKQSRRPAAAQRGRQHRASAPAYTTQGSCWAAEAGGARPVDCKLEWQQPACPKPPPAPGAPQQHRRHAQQQWQGKQDLPPQGSLPDVPLSLPLPKHGAALPGEESSDLYGSESPVRIRNTFLDSPLERSPSLERFFEERKVRSCPASGPHSRQTSGRSTPCPRVLEDQLLITTPSGSIAVTPRGGCSEGGLLDASRLEVAPQFEAMAEQGGGVHPDALAAAAAAQLARVAGCAAQEYSGVDGGSSTASSTTAGHVGHSGSGVIPLSEASGSGAIPLSQPATALDASARTVSLQELPSKGSALHPWGACKPCAFVFEAGCQNGLNCQFCHLCAPGEKKRRKKERRRIAKDVQA